MVEQNMNIIHLECILVKLELSIPNFMANFVQKKLWIASSQVAGAQRSPDGVGVDDVDVLGVAGVDDEVGEEDEAGPARVERRDPLQLPQAQSVQLLTNMS